MTLVCIVAAIIRMTTSLILLLAAFLVLERLGIGTTVFQVVGGCGLHCSSKLLESLILHSMNLKVFLVSLELLRSELLHSLNLLNLIAFLELDSLK